MAYLPILDILRSYFDIHEGDREYLIKKKMKEKMFEGFAWTLLGRLLRKEEPTQFDKAEEYILKGIQLLEELKLKAYISQGYSYLGDLYNDMGRKQEAFEHLRKAEDMFQEMGMDYHLNKTHEALARI